MNRRGATSMAETAATAASLATSRRAFLQVCAAVAGAVAMPLPLRGLALRAYAATAFSFTPAQRAVLASVADTVIPAATVRTRHGTVAVPSAGDTGAVDYIQTLLDGSMIFAAGVRRPPYVPVPPGVATPLFPSAGADPLWTVKRIAWFGDGPRPPLRPRSWPSELERLQRLYLDGVAALDAATPPSGFAAASVTVREAVLRRLQAEEAASLAGSGEGPEPFFHTMLGHLAQACFGDPVYGGNRNWVYWDMIDFTGPSFVSAGGPAPGQGWTAEQMTDQFRRRP